MIENGDDDDEGEWFPVGELEHLPNHIRPEGLPTGEENAEPFDFGDDFQPNDVAESRLVLLICLTTCNSFIDCL